MLAFFTVHNIIVQLVIRGQLGSQHFSKPGLQPKILSRFLADIRCLDRQLQHICRWLCVIRNVYMIWHLPWCAWSCIWRCSCSLLNCDRDRRGWGTHYQSGRQWWMDVAGSKSVMTWTRLWQHLGGTHKYDHGYINSVHHQWLGQCRSHGRRPQILGIIQNVEHLSDE